MSVGLEDVVEIDGMTGYIDFIGEDVIVLVSSGRSRFFSWKNITSIRMIRVCPDNQLCRVEFQPNIRKEVCYA